ncbi:MAG: aspartyl protease family protein [Saprospiraceae bacterium]
MKWTTLLFLILLLECSFAQSNIAFLKAPTPPSDLTAYAPLDAITAPLKILNGMPFVNAQLDGKSGPFLLDTGAPTLVLNAKPDNKQQDIPAASFSTSFHLSSTKVKSFGWATVQRKNLDALALDIQHLEISTQQKLLGIIGYDILKDFELFIDYPNQQVLLLQPVNNSVHKAATPLATLDIELQGHLPVIALEIGNQILRFGLDTGAGVNLMDNDCKTNLPATLFTSLGIEEIRSIDQRSTRVEGTLINKVQIADLPLNNMKYLFTELTDLEVKSDVKIDGLLGFPFFERVKCSIDYINRKLHIWAINP